MNFRILASLMGLGCFLVALSPLQAQEIRLADQYLGCLKAMWEQDASSDEVDAYGRLLGENAVYQHPRVGISIEGRATILEAMSGFLGTSRSPQLSNIEVLVGSGVTVVVFDLSMEVRSRDGWSQIDRHQLTVLEISDGKITTISDYW